MLRAFVALSALAVLAASAAPAFAQSRHYHHRHHHHLTARHHHSHHDRHRTRRHVRHHRSGRHWAARPHRRTTWRARAHYATGAARWASFAPAGTPAIRRPSRYIARRLGCAINVNAALAARGIRGTGSALAKSFLRWGHPSAPVPGAVAVYNRRGGGHAAIVSRVVHGRVYVWNPGRHGWREVAYPRRALAYRVAG
jgi:hypothetical protein